MAFARPRSRSRRPGGVPRSVIDTSLADAEPLCWWLDDVDAPPPREAVTRSISADLAVVGAGYSGLWTALLAKQADPDRDVVLLESRRIGWAASGRNGGFCSASLTHGQANGMDWYPADMPRLERLGRDNLAGIVKTVQEFAIDCKLEQTGELLVATKPYQLEDLHADHERMLDFGDDAVLLDREQTQAEVRSPTYLGGLWSRNKTVILDPARLAWGLAAACEALGVRIYEHSRVVDLSRAGRADAMVLRVAGGATDATGSQAPTEATVTARRVALATNAFPPLLKRINAYVVPVYDYAMMTEPLTEAQLDSIGWRNRQGLWDAGNQFHYSRLTEENTILWGGYDVVYHYGSKIDPALDQRPRTFRTLAEHFFTTFPQLAGLRFTHTWGGVIDTCSRFFPFFGTGYGGRVAYAVGYTGLGVGSTRFGAQVMLDLLTGRRTELTELTTIRDKPLPFPPEPLRSAVIHTTRWSMARADTHEGHRNLWLRSLDRFGLGFDS
ncbi:NAD(P)/FAD-dependent oxidoreductase [Nakamurella leprariae]|uniref:FAD-dependent oxidoreductase n=1 Tax=Nakamurella leprariae TaxID=2803911 RepID=A0A939C267_9ACTN|nr:FAD-dependent oxidoreductase [Nakamurella leprariae]MBM9467889.1 FAD-dependent oxidoreductase [Nakamurella leprariae]